MKFCLLYCIVAFGSLALGNPIDVLGNDDVISEPDIEEQPGSDAVLLADVESDENEGALLYLVDDLFEYSPGEELIGEENGYAQDEDVLADDFSDADSGQEDALVEDPQVPQELNERPMPLNKPLRLCALPPLYLGQKPQLVPSWWCQCPRGVIC